MSVCEEHPLRQSLQAIGGIAPTGPLVGVVLVVILVGIGFTFLYSWFFRSNSKSEELARQLWVWAHQTVDGDDDGVDLAKCSMSRLIRISVDQARCDVGLLSDNKANRIVVGEVIRKFMKNRGVRPSHISRQYPLAVEAYFLNSETDALVAGIRDTTLYQMWGRRGGNRA